MKARAALRRLVAISQLGAAFAGTAGMAATGSGGRGRIPAQSGSAMSSFPRAIEATISRFDVAGTAQMPSGQDVRLGRTARPSDVEQIIAE